MHCSQPYAPPIPTSAAGAWGYAALRVIGLPEYHRVAHPSSRQFCSIWPETTSEACGM